ncbi:acetolactate synthase [Thermasporomyces composti]|uniref:Acetolactate synthase-1/2/3 large subunit n=1 Tax=Thermasporomyces composti TaxID=696763 RepID=A0A3D9V5M4_THECX|nr:acetolactate synthase [Thermasporomyces composti]REF35470.1 acetolactate synthase-1/2/3 large subunit [Thermasporomyces composti]
MAVSPADRSTGAPRERSTGDWTGVDERSERELLEGHGGDLAVAVARAHGVETMFTLTGAHVFPLYDAAVGGRDRPQPPPMRLVDVRHEATAVFAAEATGKLTRTPGLAVVTAGPGVTNSVSAIAQAYQSGSPLVVLGGRAPSHRWGSGSLQELDHPPLLAPITKRARTVATVSELPSAVDEAFRLAGSRHRGPVFLDIPMDQLYSRTSAEVPLASTAGSAAGDVDHDTLAEVATLLAQSARPVLVLGSDVWLDGAEAAALEVVEELGVPVVTNGMGRGVVPRGHLSLVSRARGVAFGRCDLALVVGTPLDFRLNFGAFGGRDGAPPAQVVHLVDAPDQVASHVDLAASVAGDLTAILTGLVAAWRQVLRPPDWSAWHAELRAAADAAREQDAALLTADTDPIHPARVYGELLPLLDDDAVIIGDGGDFVSFAGRFLSPGAPGCWLDPGPFGCLGAGLGAAIAARIARPSSQVVVLLGDGAAGMSLLDVDTLVRHRLPVLMVVGNNGCWGLEKHPMRMLYGYDVATDLRPGTPYDAIVAALGGAAETVRRPAELGPALRRGFASDVPYLVNVLTDPDAAYPRSTFGI